MFRRPLVAIFLFLVGGIFLGKIGGLKSLPPRPIILICLIPGFALPLLWKFPRLLSLAISLILVVLGICLYGYTYFDADPLYGILPHLETIEGEIVSYPTPYSSGRSFIIKPYNYPGKLKVYSSTDDLYYNPGQIVRIKGQFSVPSPFNGFDYPRYLQRKRIWGLIYSANVSVIGTNPGFNLKKIGWLGRKFLIKLIDKTFARSSGLVKALLLGEDNFLQPQSRNGFKKTGLAHLLAASGLHLGILLSGLWALFRLFHLTPKTIYIIILIPVGAYLIVVGFKTSLTRAFVIFVVGGLSYVFWQKGIILREWRDHCQSLAAAGLIIVGIHPLSVFNVGFQLSFCATFSLVVFAKPINDLLQPIKVRSLRMLIAGSLAAQLGVTPIVVYHFQELHPWVTTLNIIAIPIVTVLLYGVAASLALTWLPIGGKVVARSFDMGLALFEQGLQSATTIPYISVPLGDFNPIWIGAYLFIVMALKVRLEKLGTEQSYTLYQTNSHEGSQPI